MRIISWNCNMAYAAKKKNILAFQPDILILQECSEKHIKESGAVFHHWVGNNPHKGLGVLGFGDHSYTLDSSYTHEYPWFIPFRVDDAKLNILGIWSHVKNGRERYVTLTHQAIDHYRTFLAEGLSIITGDFNSNSIWDASHPGRSHSDLVEKLEQLNLRSVYHYQTKEAQGSETVSTLYMYRHKDKGYHLDYAFLSKNLLDRARLTIPDADAWLKLSDHLPLILDVNLGISSQPKGKGRKPSLTPAFRMDDPFAAF